MKHFCSLSEAIREGAKTGPQCVEVYAVPANRATCALGAAVVAMGKPEILKNGWPMEFLWAEFPYIEHIPRACPAECGWRAGEFLGLIAHLNDVHVWTREAIADWLEGEEAKLGFVTITITEDQESSIQSRVGEAVGV